MNLTPEDYAMLLQLGNENGSLEDQIEMQRQQAQLVRKRGATPQGQMAGNVFVGPAWTQYMAALAENKSAGDYDRQAQRDQKLVRANSGRQNDIAMRAMTNSVKYDNDPLKGEIL